MSPRTWLAATFVLALGVAAAADSERDFSGKWRLDADHSEMHGLIGEIYPALEIAQDATIHCVATTAIGGRVEWSFHLDGSESRDRVGSDSWNSKVKWEGTALLTNTLVTAPEPYTIMDRWSLSKDRSQLNMEREIERNGQIRKGTLLYRREGPNGAAPTLERRPAAPPAPPPPAQYTVPAGTHILLTLNNPLSTKNSQDGDHVYLQTAVPISESNRIVIPRGSYVQGSISKSKPAGRGGNKGEIYIEFDCLTLPNGVTRDFHSRLSNADTANGKVDPSEGKISGTGRNTQPGEIGRDAGIGSVGGVLIGSAAGHPIAGAAVGAAAGAAAVLLAKNKDVVLPRGTSVELVLDRDLLYSAAEIH